MIHSKVRVIVVLQLAVCLLFIHKKTLPCQSLCSSEYIYSVFINVSASIVLVAAKFTLIYLELDTSWAANLDRVINKILSTDIAEEVVPVYCCFGRYLRAGDIAC